MAKGYKNAISPYLVRSCRFYPTCSSYTCEALETYGALRAAPRIAWRVLRCNPFSRGGYDPVRSEEKEI